MNLPSNLPFRSLTTRVFLILIAGVVVTTALTVGLAFGERQRMIAQFRDYNAVERVAQFVQSLETVPEELRPAVLRTVSNPGMHAELASDEDVPKEVRSEFASRLQQRLTSGHEVVSAQARAGDCTPMPGAPPRRPGPGFRPACEAMLVTLGDGARLRLTVMPPRQAPPLAPAPEALVYGIVFLLCIGALAWLVTRMAMRPLKQLAQAATALGNDIERPPLPERGAIEIRQAAVAFNAMQARIRHHIRQRSQILAAITHDLQTPLTRLRLRLEKVDDAELRDKLIADLSAMQTMVREGLDLARSMDSAETPQRLDLDSLVDSVCADAADAGQQVSFRGRTGASLLARPVALRRCLTNLIDNAVKYGRFADVTVSREPGFAVIHIRDGGAGIPEAEMEKVFEPFYRLENSRSRSTGGTGLGLAISRNIAEQHGGTIKLHNLPKGGLEATLRFPLQA
jgi:signal transduction histidine kinase